MTLAYENNMKNNFKQEKKNLNLKNMISATFINTVKIY